MEGSRSKLLIVAFGLATAILSCERFDGKELVVEFRSAEGIEPDLGVWLAGTEIGTTGETRIVEGRVEVSVRLHRDYHDALPKSAVFVLARDSDHPGKNRLVVYDMTAVAPELQTGPERFQGFRSVIELALVVGTEKAQKIWEGLSQLQLAPEASNSGGGE